MCYNCGCGIPDDDMGKGNLTSGGENLTDEDIQKMAENWGMSFEDTLKSIIETAEDKLKELQKKS